MDCVYLHLGKIMSNTHPINITELDIKNISEGVMVKFYGICID
jgi:hypothetical protein